MVKLRIVSFMAAVLVVPSILAACGQNGENGKENQNGDGQQTVQKTEYKGGPAELLVLDINTGTTDEQFKKFFVDPVKAKYPQINLVQTRDPLDKLLAAGTPPDMVLVSNPALATILEADIPEDLTAMVKTYGIDLGRMDKAVVQEMMKLGDQKAFYGMPFAMNYGATVYNKDIFDKFGVSYPKDVMTYEEMLEMGKKLTRTDGGTNYIGVMPPDLRQMYWQYGLPVFDKTKGKASFTSDKHAQVFALLKQFYSIPGYVLDGKYRHSTDLFFKEQRMAMFPNLIAAFNIFFTNAGTKDAFIWDLAAYPSYSDRQGVGLVVDFHMAVVNKSGKNKEAAYLVLLGLVSENVQTMLSKAGRLSVLNDPGIRNVYGADNDLFKGKNLQAIFKVTPSPLPEASKYDPKINGLLNEEVTKSVVIDGTDINTALRNGEEKANKEVVDVLK